MSRPQKTIYVTFQQEGIHCYPEAATDENLKDVSFLGVPHRHIFHVKVWLEVKHDNRDVEFILLKRELQKQFSNDEFNSKSCEMICDDIALYIQNKYPNRWIAVDVSEDGENGSYAEYETHIADFKYFMNEPMISTKLPDNYTLVNNPHYPEVTFKKDITDKSVDEFFGAP